MYRLFALLRRLWVACGEPFPGFIRFVRYNLFGRIWPVSFAGNGTDLPVIQNTPPEVAVIIPCHNYGQYLREALDSVLAQTVKPVEILVVDDASDDDTAEIARSYAQRGVRLLQVQNHSLARTRNSGAHATIAPYLLYLDADDRLPRKYIQRCLKAMKQHNVGIAYGDRAQFGARKRYIAAPAFSERLLMRNNFISSHALILREAFDRVGGYRDNEGSLEDWDFYRRVVAMGYTARHARTSVQYRMHDESMGYLLRQDPNHSYKRAAALAHHPVTIFTAFTGNTELFEQYLERLKHLKADPHSIRLYWYNLSPDPAFDARLRTALSTLPFRRITYSHTPFPEENPHSPLQKMRAYTEIIRTCDTEYLMTLEEDIRFPESILDTMQQAMSHDFVAVIAPCKSLTLPRYDMWHFAKDGSIFYPHSLQATGTEYVSGADLGCTLFRTHELRTILPVGLSAAESFERLLYAQLASCGRVMCDWKSEVERVKA